MQTNNPFSCWLSGIPTVSTDKRYWHHFLSEQYDKQALILEELKINVFIQISPLSFSEVGAVVSITRR
jgi:hypothetical protein